MSSLVANALFSWKIENEDTEASTRCTLASISLPQQEKSSTFSELGSVCFAWTKSGLECYLLFKDQGREYLEYLSSIMGDR
jgi:hypothetical protein